MDHIRLNCCLNCEHFSSTGTLGGDGICKRYPQDVDKNSCDTCGEFAPCSQALSDEILETSVFAPGWFSAHTTGVLRRNKIKVVADLLDLGRTSMRTPEGSLEREAIRDVAKKLSEFGVKW